MIILPDTIKLRNDKNTDVLKINKNSLIRNVKNESHVDSSILVGKSVLIADRYRVVQELPCYGGEADVYICEDCQTNNHVAIKVYRINIRPREELMKEMIALSHVNIVRLIDFFTWNQRFIEVMEYAKGGTLNDHMPFDEENLEKIILPQAIEALNYLHNKDIIHRDVKPSNLFIHHSSIITNDKLKPQILLGDFGISSLVRGGECSLHYSLTGSKTIEFSAPELFSGHYSIATDYYALGISLLFLLTGDNPFAGMTNERIQVIHLSEDILPPKGCSARFQTLIQGLLHKVRDKRWGYDEIRKWLEGENVQVSPQEYFQQQNFYYKLGKDLVARNPYQLGEYMLKFPNLARRHIRQPQLYESFNIYDQALASRLHDIRERAGNLEEMYIEVVYTLNPELPYRLLEGYAEVHTPGELAKLIDSDPKTWDAGKEQLSNGSILAWLRATGHEEVSDNWQKMASKFITK